VHRELLEVLCCPFCHGELRLTSGGRDEKVDIGALSCAACERDFVIEVGIPVLGDRELMARVCDRWTEGMLSQELYKRNLRNSRQWYDSSPEFARFVDAAAAVEGFIADVASGPGASFSGALVPRLSERAHFVMTDAALHMLHGLRDAWLGEPRRATLDFVACDCNRLPFRSSSLDGLTSASGFDCVQDDPTRARVPGAARAYREGQRVLKTGGLVFNESRIYDDESKTAAYLMSLGCANASRESLAQLWDEIGFEVVSKTYLDSHRGKSDPGDGLPIDDSDEWHVMAWVLRKR
jgi:uncharacterized protein YbaR (Trm112 family)/ubiquinone/menaquinone biosynthesis C-methylase UbiE